MNSNLNYKNLQVEGKRKRAESLIFSRFFGENLPRQPRFFKVLTKNFGYLSKISKIGGLGLHFLCTKSCFFNDFIACFCTQNPVNFDGFHDFIVDF